MPRKIRRIRRSMRKTPRGKRGYGRKRMKTVSLSIRGPTVVPDRMFTKLKYNVNQVVDANPLAPTVRWTFVGNSLFDPEQAVGGNQPLGFDQWAAFYNDYRVHAAHISVNIMSASNASGSFVKAVLFPSLSAVPGNITASTEQPYSKRGYIAYAPGMNKLTLNSKMQSKKLFGVKSIAYSDTFSSLFNSSPSDLWYWHVQFASVNGIDNIVGLYMDVKITYYAEFFGRVELGRS